MENLTEFYPAFKQVGLKKDRRKRVRDYLQR